MSMDWALYARSLAGRTGEELEEDLRVCRNAFVDAKAQRKYALAAIWRGAAIATKRELLRRQHQLPSRRSA